MLRILLEHRGLVSAIVAAGVWSFGHLRVPFPATNDMLVLVAAKDALYVLTTAGELVESMDAAVGMQGSIDRVGRHGPSRWRGRREWFR